MSTYAVGDLQGCIEPLRRLLENIGFDKSRDRLWLVGDLVNRGPDSLACLRFVRDLGASAICVLGNHDLHLLSVAEDCAKRHRTDTLDAILCAPDRAELLDWLRKRPLMHAESDWVMVHAGLLPQWNIDKAINLAHEVEAVLSGPGYRGLIATMYGNQPDRWEDCLEGYDRLRVIINSMTRMRFCSPDGAMEFAAKGPPDTAPPGYLPWFNVPERASAEATVVCGHWSTLGLRNAPNLIALDTGCVWGGSLTGIRLEDRKVFQVACSQD